MPFLGGFSVGLLNRPGRLSSHSAMKPFTIMAAGIKIRQADAAIYGVSSGAVAAPSATVVP